MTRYLRNQKIGHQVKLAVVPTLLFLSSILMALAWLGHLRYREQLGYLMALGISWMIVLPEYVLNTAATRYGIGTYSGAQMASFNLVFGVVCVAFVSYLVLGENFTDSQLVGFGLLAVAIVLITHPR